MGRKLRVLSDMVHMVATVLYSSPTLGCMWSFGMCAFFYFYELILTWLAVRLSSSLLAAYQQSGIQMALISLWHVSTTVVEGRLQPLHIRVADFSVFYAPRYQFTDLCPVSHWLQGLRKDKGCTYLSNYRFRLST